MADPGYEAAIRILRDAERCFLDLVLQEEARPNPDHEAIAHWRAGAWWCAQERLELRRGDEAAAARVCRQWKGFVARGRAVLAGSVSQGAA